MSLVLVCLGIWLHAADSLLVATMVPAIVKDLGGAELISWTVVLYGIGSIVAGASSGLLALHFGLRRPMTAAALTFTVGCIISATAPHMWVVLVGRLFQGLGGGGLLALSFVAVGTLFPRRLVGRAMGAIGSLWGVSAFMGPLIGGLFVEHATWRGGFWFFAVQAVLLAVTVQFALKDRDKPRPEERPRFPFWRLLWLSAGVFFICYAGIDITPLKTGICVVIGISLLVVFLWLDGKKIETRLLPRHPFSLRRPLGAALTQVLTFSMTMAAITVYGPYLMTELYGATALVGGYVMACMSISWAVSAFIISGIPERLDARMIMIGMCVITLSLLAYVYTLPHGPIWLVGLSAAMQGCGFGMAWSFILRRAVHLAPPEEHERVSSAIPTIQRLGFAIGAAYVGIIANAAGLTENSPPEILRQIAFVIPLACLPAAAIGLVATVRFVLARAE